MNEDFWQCGRGKEKLWERFSRDTEKHVLSVLQDDGVYRHLSYGPEGSGMMRVDLVTWPGHLAYSGGMGCFVFSRVEDMFDFFRGSGINPGYWEEKIQGSKHGATKWSPALFEEKAREWAGELRESATGVLEEEVLCQLEGMSKEMAYSAVMGLKIDGDYPFQDFYEVDTDVFTFHYLWACTAIVRVIGLYDKEAAP